MYKSQSMYAICYVHSHTKCCIVICVPNNSILVYECFIFVLSIQAYINLVRVIKHLRTEDSILMLMQDWRQHSYAYAGLKTAFLCLCWTENSILMLMLDWRQHSNAYACVPFLTYYSLSSVRSIIINDSTVLVLALGRFSTFLILYSQ
jgi:hypothetical protein